MKPIVVTVGPLVAPNAANIAASQTPGAAGNLTLTAGAIAGTTPDTARRVLFTPAGAEATNSTVWTVYGTDWNSQPQSETVNGVNNPTTVYTAYDYRTVTRIAVNKAQAGAVTVGTNGIASSRPVFLDYWSLPDFSANVVVSGTINYTVQQSLDNPNDPDNPVTYPNVTWFPFMDSNLISATTSQQSVTGKSPVMVQLLVNSNTNPATARMTIVQYSTSKT